MASANNSYSDLVPQKILPYTLIIQRPCWEGGGGTHISRLNFKTSCVAVYKCFTSLLEIERKFLVFVGILEKGDSDVW